MANECKNYTDVISTLNYHDKKQEELLGVDLTKGSIDFLPRVVEKLARVARGSKLPINEKHLKKAIKDIYGTVDEKIYLVTKFHGLLSANPGLENIMERFLALQVTRMEDIGSEIGWSTNELGVKALDLKTLPVNVLRSAVNEIQSRLRHDLGQKIGKGLLGPLELQFVTPKQMARKDPSGAIDDMRINVRDHATEQANRIARFMQKDPSKTDYVTLTSQKTGKKMKPQVRNYGMEDIVDSIQQLAYDESLNILDSPRAKIILHDMFVKYNMKDDTFQRWLKIDKNGDMTVATKYEQTEEFYKSTGDPIYAFREYKKYEEVYGEDAINFNEKMLKKFLSEAERYRELHKNVWEYFKEQFEISAQQLYSEIRSLFPKEGWTDKDITQLFFQEDPSDYKKWRTLNKDQKKLISFIHTNATRYNILKPFVFNSRKEVDKEGNEDKGRDSYPIGYDQMKFSFQWDEMIYKYEQRLQLVERELQNPELSIETYRVLMKDRKRYLSILKRAYWIRDRKDDYPVDMQTGTYLPLGTDSKHIEHISNAFNIMESRTDAGAYNAYLTEMASRLERNKLATTFIKNLKRAESEPVQDYITNLFKVATYQPDAASGFLWLKYDSDSVSKLFGKMGINISPAKIDRKMKQVLAFTSGNLLRGYGTAVQNYTAVIQKFIDVGVDRVLEAMKILKDGGKDLERILSLSGVIDFREFFSTKLTNDAVNLGAQRKHIMDMTVAMAKYWKDVGKLNKKSSNFEIKKNKLKKQLEKDFGRAINTIPDPERLDKRIKVQRDTYRLSMLQKYVDYAINKEYEAAPYVKNWVYNKLAPIAEQFANLERAFTPTMGKTEAHLRALSFIIGIRSSMRKQFIADKKITDLEGDELKAAIAMGREYTEEMDFGLSRWDIGQAGQSEIGSFFTKFKVWPFQKFAKDLDTIRLAYQELRDVDNKYFDGKAGAKMLASLIPFTKNQKALRTASPALAAFRTWIFTQGLWTAIWDFAIMGPFLLVPGVKKVSRLIPGVRTIGGASSDLISLLLLIPGLAVAMHTGEGDDELEKIFDYYSRRTIFGLGARWSIDFFLTMLAAIEDEDNNEYSRRVAKTLAPWSPPVVKELIATPSTVKDIIEAVE